jgi:hypothetical protein
MNEFWIELLRRIPVKHHDNLALVSTTGQEIFVQQFYRFDPDFMVMRARLSGSTEGSRVIILPYKHIDYLAFVKVLPESEVQSVFGTDGSFVPPAAQQGTPLAVAAEPTPQPAPIAVEEKSESPAPAVQPTAAPVAAPATKGPGVIPVTMGPAAAIKNAPPPTRMPAAQADGDSAEKDPAKISKTLLLARLRERMNQKGR